MKLTLTLLLFLSLNAISGQNRNIGIKYGESYDKELVDSVLDSLHRKNEFVVSFRITSTWRRTPDFLIITKERNSISAFKYANKSGSHLRKLSVVQDSLKILWNPFITDLFKIKNSRDISDDCSRDTSQEGRIRYYKMLPEDSHNYNFIILSKTQMKNLNYYDPEFFEKYCGSVVERQKIIKCVLMIKKILRSAVAH